MNKRIHTQAKLAKTSSFSPAGSGPSRRLLDQAGRSEPPSTVPTSRRLPEWQIDAGAQARAGHNFGRISVYGDAPRTIQPNLRVSAPGDQNEREADSLAEVVTRLPGQGIVNPERPTGARLQVGRAKASDVRGAPVPPIVQEVLRSPGRPLDARSRNPMESSLGRSLDRVRVYTDARAAESALALDARAYTAGNDIVFGAGEYRPGEREGQRLIAHELTHVAQQEGVAGNLVQRYESGEHAQLGETQTQLQAAFAPGSYKVRKGDTLDAIAGSFKITVAELKAANESKLKRWPASDGSGRLIEGFDAGETIVIPQALNDLGAAAVKDKAAKFTVNGVVLDYGVAIAMGDFFESPDQMAKASPKELTELSNLIKREQSGGKPVTTEEWQKATGGRYLKLAEQNVAHFAPPNPAFVTPSTAGATTANHKSEWEKHHRAALDASKGGDKDGALMINAYADHFLTDSFSAGHLVNKPDVMAQFKGQLQLDAKGEEFTQASKKFFDDVAAASFTGSVKTEFSKYETYKPYALGWKPNIDSVSRFSALLQGIHKKEPDLLANAVAKGLHDNLNTLPGGLPVENASGDAWTLSGDGTLNAKTTEIARKAVAQSQINVISAFRSAAPINYPALYKKVWDHAPAPSKTGTAQLVSEVKKGTEVASADLRKAIVDLIRANYLLIIDELVKRNELKKA